MTLEELEATLPHGFHDAELSRVEIDYHERCVRFDVDVWVGDLDAPPGPEREKYRPARVQLTGLLFCVIERPDPSYPYTDPPSISELLAVQPPTPLPSSAFEARLFITEWNSFIHVAAQDASLEWRDGASRQC